MKTFYRIVATIMFLLGILLVYLGYIDTTNAAEGMYIMIYGIITILLSISLILMKGFNK